MKKSKNKILFISCLSLLFLLLSSLFSGVIVHEIMFNKVKRPDYSITPGIVNYNEINDKIVRFEHDYYSFDNKIKGYYYPCNDAKALIVMSCGLNDGADSLLAITLYFLNNNYSVFTYDYSNCFDSKGKNGGFYQSLIDLNATLSYLNSNDTLNDYKFLLFGFSLGAFASCSIFNIYNDNIYGSASVSGFNDASTIFFNNAKRNVGPLMYLGKPFVQNLIKNRFNNYLSYTSLKGINNTDKPIFLANSKKDEVVAYSDSISYMKDYILNSKVTYYISDDATHTGIIYSKKALEYQKEVNDTLNKMIIKNKKKSYIESVDDNLYSQLNNDLFNNIISFYNNCL